MAKQIPFVTGEIYHIFNRGVRKGKIFFINQDYQRWEDQLHWCLQFDYTYSKYLLRLKQAEISGQNPKEVLKEIEATQRLPKPPVEILAYTHMPNHFHLILKQIVDMGISNFMHRVATGHAKYLNQRHDLIGAVYQGPFAAVRVETEEQFIHLVRYIHINAVEAGLITPENILDYSWSSLSSYITGQHNKLLTKKYLMQHFKKTEKLLEFTLAPIETKDVNTLEGVALDDDFGWYKTKEKEKKVHLRRQRQRTS